MVIGVSFIHVSALSTVCVQLFVINSLDFLIPFYLVTWCLLFLMLSVAIVFSFSLLSVAGMIAARSKIDNKVSDKSDPTLIIIHLGNVVCFSK